LGSEWVSRSIADIYDALWFMRIYARDLTPKEGRAQHDIGHRDGLIILRRRLQVMQS
jgi:hypothetical protein